MTEIELLRADLDALRGAIQSILWMAHEYAEAGGSRGPEMRDYRAAARVIHAEHPSLVEPLDDDSDMC